MLVPYLPQIQAPETPDLVPEGENTGQGVFFPAVVLQRYQSEPGMQEGMVLHLHRALFTIAQLKQ